MKYVVNILMLCLFLTFANSYSNEKIQNELDSLASKLAKFEQSNEKQSLNKSSAILSGRRAPYAMIYEHTGLFEWQILTECFYDFEVDTTSTVNVDVDYKPNDDLFPTIPAYFYFCSKRPYDSLDEYKNLMVYVFQALGTDVNVLVNEQDSKYGHTGYHYCQSFSYNGTKYAIDSYFVYVDDVACVVYYMTGYSFYQNFLYKIFFDIVMDVLDFKDAPNAVAGYDQRPVSFDLAQNYPNPFNSETKITYSVSTPSNVKLELFNLQGQLVKTLVNSFHNTGDYQINCNANDLASGIYIYRISSPNDYKSHRMILIK